MVNQKLSLQALDEKLTKINRQLDEFDELVSQIGEQSTLVRLEKEIE